MLESITALLQNIHDEHFEDGMESEFSRRFIALILANPPTTLAALSDVLSAEQVNAEVAAEALRWLGRMESPDTELQRRLILEQGLKSPTSRVRDGAILGLASLNDPDALPALEHAIQQETIPELRADMVEVLEQLKQSRLETTR